MTVIRGWKKYKATNRYLIEHHAKPGHALMENLKALPPDDVRGIIAELPESEAAALLYDWRFWARPNQLAPTGSWTTWLLLAGRGGGKTRSGAEWIRERVNLRVGQRIALIGKTPRDARITMLEGDSQGSGLLEVFPPHERPLYNPSLAQVTFHTGAVAHIFSGEEPDQLRGPSHDTIWCDEIAKFRDPQAVWDQAMFGLRLGARPQVCVTTTPRPIPLLKELIADPSTVTVRWHTDANIENLSPTFLTYIRRKYEGTQLGRQELAAEILSDQAGALWTRALIERTRVAQPPGEWVQSEILGPDGKKTPPRFVPHFKRVVIGVDPAVTSGPDADETGLVIVGLSDAGHIYVIADLSDQHKPSAWARIAVESVALSGVDRIVGEVNNGGDLVEQTLRTVRDEEGREIGKMAPFRAVRASRGKRVRAEPCAALFEQGRAHFVGALPELEDQLATWVPGESMMSPDRLDAMVWAVADLVQSVEQGYHVERV